jgi:hypothetical protein
MSQETLAIVGSLGVFLLAIVLLFARSRMKEKFDGATFIAVLLAPLIVYGILSGRLAEFSAAGVSAKFQAVAEMAIDPTEIVRGADPLDVVSKGGFDMLREFTQRLDPTRPNAVSLSVGRTGYYQPDAIATYIRALQAAGSATYVIFVEEGTGKFVGSASSEQVHALLTNPDTSQAFMNELEHPAGESPFSTFRFLVRESLATTDSNAAALDKFLASGAQALVVLDQNGQPTGLVDRDRLMTKLMKTLAAGPS